MYKRQIHPQAIQLLVENNFDSIMPNSKSLTTKGIGLKNVEKRLALLYPNRYQLTVKDTANLYQVQLTLELEENNKD